MSCEVCKDSGYVVDKDNTIKKCKCVIKAELVDFVKHYDNYKFDKRYAKDTLIENILFSNMDMEKFGSIVKTFLCYLHLRDTNATWKDISGQDLVSITFGEDEIYAVQDLQDIDFLIIKLGRDSYNRSLGSWLLNLLTRRQELNKITWIYLYPRADIKFNDIYGQELNAFIKDKQNFKAIK